MAVANSHLVNEEALKAWLNISQRAALEKHLRSHGVPIIYGRGGCICTTMAAINKAMGIATSDGATKPEEIEFL